jgi:hypothetical protein
MAARSVVVVMPFGGTDGTERRRAILNFKRLEYLVRNKCHVTATGTTGEPVAYAVEVAKTAMDDIPEKVLQQIDTADVLIALVVERNPTVIYELAYRQARDRAVRDRTIILVVDSVDNLPLYVKSWAYQSWKRDEVLERIDQIAKDSFRELIDFSVGIPDDLKRAIDIYDGELQRGLEDSLREIEAKFVPHQNEAVQYLRGILSDKISTFFPCSIVEVAFSKRGEFADPKCPAIVRDFDDAFSRLYGYVDKRGMEADHPLTLPKLLARIGEFVDQGDWQRFIKEQTELTETVIKQYGFARATIPLRLGQKHARSEYRGTCYLPCIMAQVIDGNLDGPHQMYLLVVYVELPNTLTPAGSTATTDD